MITAIMRVSLRAMLGRRRMILLVLLAAIPVLLAMLLRTGGTTAEASRGPAVVASNLTDLLVIRVVLPLVSLVLGTGVLGSELEDGTAVYLLAKPVPRWKIVAAKLIVAAGVSMALVGISTLVTVSLVVAGEELNALVIALTVATVAGAAAYCATFLALSIVTTRAFIVGLIYTLIWEGVLAGLFEGTRVLSIRQYVLGLANGLSNRELQLSTTPLGLPTAIVGVCIVVVAAVGIATLELARSEVRPAD